MLKRIRLWYARNYQVLSVIQAQRLGLTFVGYVYDEEAYYLHCRAIWIDDKGRFYRVTRIPSL